MGASLYLETGFGVGVGATGLGVAVGSEGLGVAVAAGLVGSGGFGVAVGAATGFVGAGVGGALAQACTAAPMIAMADTFRKSRRLSFLFSNIALLLAKFRRS